jgi:hypothetical protein
VNEAKQREQGWLEKVNPWADTPEKRAQRERALANQQKVDELRRRGRENNKAPRDPVPR